MKTRLAILLLGCIFALNGALPVSAQVTIGKDKEPESFSVLEISTADTKGGLRLPQLTTAQRGALSLQSLTEEDEKGNAQGLTIFNTDTQCFEYWNSSKWISLCDGQSEGTVDFTNCNTISVEGVYDTDLLPKDQDIRIVIPVTVTDIGTYNYIGTVNNVTFHAKGAFVNFGPQNIYLYPVSTSGTVTAGVTLPATIEIGPLTGGGSIVCNSVSVKFVSRQTSTLKILNLTGGEDDWDITASDGGDYSANSPVGWVARWVSGTATLSGVTKTALEYAGTAGIQIISLNPTSGGAIASLDEMLAETSIVWVGANDATTRFNAGIVQVLTEWAKSGQGYVVTVADKIAGGSVSQNLGLIIEDGSSVNGFTVASNMPEVFQGTDVPYNLTNGLEVPRAGANAGYITSKGGITFLRTGSGVTPDRKLGVYNPATYTFGFADKFGSEQTASGGFNSSSTGSAAQAYNLQRVLTDIWAYMLQNAPVK